MKKIKVLLEMRPALEGFAGIPQEVRLLFRGLRTLSSIEVEGMLQTSHRRLAKGTPFKESALKKLSQAKRYEKHSNVIISMAEKPYRNVLEWILDWFQKKADSLILQLAMLTNIGKIRFTRFESAGFEDFTWRTLFARTLPASDFDLVAKANHRVNPLPWHLMHVVGLSTLNWRINPLYPKISTQGIDIFIGQTPYPARVERNTAMVIRYHDAIPIFMPHTIPDKSIHQATHFYALMSNIKSGAWFACVSEATRQDLLRMFPEVSNKAVVIHNMVSHHYFEENSNSELVPGIIRGRLHEGDAAKNVDLAPSFFTLREKENFYQQKLRSGKLKYILMVSTIEPRKNHIRLLAAWEVIKAEIDPSLKLVIVGGLGWDYAQTVRAFKPWIDQGELFVLSSVPAPDLRVLYRHAALTVCPSLGEGFDFSGVESMASGGITVASDIPVHREIYGDAAEYFDPYSTMSVVTAIKHVLYEDAAAENRKHLLKRGIEIAGLYRPEIILPKWSDFLKKITAIDNSGQ